jgi:hypothetical protein
MEVGFTTRAKTGPIKIRIPIYEELVWVQCKGYRCMAYPDAAGKWINFYTGEKLTGLVKVIG